MIAELAKTILEILKLAPRLIVALGAASAILLFSNDQLLRRLGVFEMVQKYRFALGIALVLSVAVLGVNIGLFIVGRLRLGWQKKRIHQQGIERLNNLTEDEKQILRYYIGFNTRASMLRYDDGVVQGLAQRGIIYQSSSLGSIFQGFPYNISDWAWNYLQANAHVLDGYTKTYRTDKDRSWRDPL